MSEQNGSRCGQLRLAVVTTAGYFMPHLLGRFFQKYPGITVSLEVKNRGHNPGQDDDQS